MVKKSNTLQEYSQQIKYITRIWSLIKIQQIILQNEKATNGQHNYRYTTNNTN